jgi:2-keto-4-pentenoate hydratase/2-oxohepta-3-ene-1,7-dioic acid hydratase in catechol pathway
MKLATIQTATTTTVAALQGDQALTFPASVFPTDMLAWIQGGQPLLAQAAAALAGGQCTALGPSEYRVLTPLARPGKVVAIGLNYMDHVREQKIKAPDRPIVFTKFTTAIVGPGDAISWDPELTNQVDYEVELGVVIGKRARYVTREDALSYVYGYTVINDLSARDLQFADQQWVRAKSLDTFCPVGPAILTADEVPDPQALHLKCSVNGRVLQNSTTAEMIFPVAEIISRLSRAFTFEPGDLIATGTPDGVGVFQKPPVFLNHGDVVVAEVEKIGALENHVDQSHQ